MGDGDSHSISCNAAVLWAPGEKFKIERIKVAAPRKDQVRVKVAYAAMCQTDVTILNMQALAPLFPIVGGHESAGIVESVGEGVANVQAGDHVLPFMQAQCGVCASCKDERTNVCKSRPISLVSAALLGDDEPHFTTEDGKTLNRFAGLSSFSEYIVVHKDNVVKINSEAPMREACLLSCGVATGMGAVWKVAKMRPHSTAAIFGLGTVGLAVVQACKLSGASRIIGVDVNPSKSKQAMDFGLTDLINPKDLNKPIPKVIQELTAGGVDYSFECVGGVKLMDDAVESTKKEGGMTVIIGVPSNPTANMTINVHGLLQGRTISGTVMGGLRIRDLPELVDRCLRKEFQLEPFVTHTLPFSQINEAMDIFCSGNCLRCVLQMST